MPKVTDYMLSILPTDQNVLIIGQDSMELGINLCRLLPIQVYFLCPQKPSAVYEAAIASQYEIDAFKLCSPYFLNERNIQTNGIGSLILSDRNYVSSLTSKVRLFPQVIILVKGHGFLYTKLLHAKLSHFMRGFGFADKTPNIASGDFYFVSGDSIPPFQRTSS